ncbi:ribosomal protein L15 [Dichomitus squalens]|uniref:Ribosomal protein L15 n=1 Tax=Dichomitus squalens TaxID=114155 RepID=A0A4Q9P746_9APHY|nr:ribosomal protein L15 [Dichomitus squalens LYAD-421 SS1]EJF62438.1 ribosomal protein L15 [Dichomitus squalens LYAD-421 SS1]TBU28888.1 ribosomal protein L15 [Dichomitus squalens]TBU50108.1 ribosomal protein L15 [Dichomitus squalens]TBU66130.1 ribosomal protein L15 [Dichomitus squalens]
MSGVASRFKATSSRVHLFNLSPAPGSQSTQKRLGRGRSSGLGKTSGRGHKGQKARAGNGKPKAGFEGGQTTIVKRFPKTGFVNQNQKTYAPVNLDRIQHWIDTGRLTSSPDKPITARELLLSGCIHQVHDGIKLLGNGAQHLKSAIHITPARASQSAIRAVEKTGGSVFCKYYNELALRDSVKGNTEHIQAAPTRKNDILWYTSWRNRGYLSPTALNKMPVVEERWRSLSKQLLAFKSQDYDKAK